MVANNPLMPLLTASGVGLFFLVIFALAIALVMTYDLGRRGRP